MAKVKSKKISFCITCMNRLHHVQKTLPKNIEDNYLPDDVEFVLLDYNSKDGLEQWVQQNMQSYIDVGILNYYKTMDSEYYLRSHSRNMAFRLASGEILCNLDADNFLGEGFAVEMIKEFAQQSTIFYTSDFSSADAFGRVCVLQKDFLAIHGYNEAFAGYGYEDNDLFARLKKHQLKHLQYYNKSFNNAIKHPKLERINNESIHNELFAAYISYIDPFASEILFLYNDLSFKSIVLNDIGHADLIKNPSGELKQSLGILSTFLTKDPKIGVWRKGKTEYQVALQYNHEEVQVDMKLSVFNIGDKNFYKIEDNDFLISVICASNTAINEWISIQMINSGKVVNPNGFGKGVVYKNLNNLEPISLK